MEGWELFMFYYYIGRAAVYTLGVGAITGIVTLGLAALRRLGLFQRPVTFFSVLVGVLALHLFTVPYRVYHDFLGAVLYEVEAFLEEADNTIASLQERYEVVTVPIALSKLQQQLEAFEAQLRQSWERAQVFGGVLALLALILWGWSRLSSLQWLRQWLRGIAYGCALAALFIPIIMGSSLSQAVAGAEWNRPQTFTLAAKTPPSATGGSTFSFEGISSLRGSPVDFRVWGWYALPMMAPFLLLALRWVPQRGTVNGERRPQKASV